VRPEAKRSPTTWPAVRSAIERSAIRARCAGGAASSAEISARTRSSSVSRTTKRFRKLKDRNELAGGPRNELSGGSRPDPPFGLRSLLLERPQHPVPSARGGGRSRGRLRGHRFPRALGAPAEASLRR